MEVLNVLEQKIGKLIELVKKVQEQNAQLLQERAQLCDQLELLERALLVRNQSAEDRSKELALTQGIVDELIKSIDSVVEQHLAGDTCKLKLSEEQEASR